MLAAWDNSRSTGAADRGHQANSSGRFGSKQTLLRTQAASHSCNLKARFLCVISAIFSAVTRESKIDRESVSRPWVAAKINRDE